MQKRIKLICFDLDGTFLADDKSIPERNLCAIEDAAKKGVHIVPASGRIYTGIPEILRSLPFIRYYISSNGAQVYDAQEDRILSRAEIDAELVLRFYEYADSIPCIYDCYKAEKGYLSQRMWDVFPDYVPNPTMLRYIMSMRCPVPELKEYVKENGGGIQKLQLFFNDTAERAKQLETLPGLFPEFSFTSSMPFNIEINSAACSKGAALESLCAHLGFEACEAMALGDGTNDLSMLQSAGLAVAMENAVDSLKAAADYVCPNNNDAGFAQAVKKFVLS